METIRVEDEFRNFFRTKKNSRQTCPKKNKKKDYT